MKKMILLLLVLFAGVTSKAQTFKTYKAGHVFNISLPDYMARVTGLNDAAIFQFQNTVKNIAGCVIEDNKSELALIDMKYASTQEFYEQFTKGFLVDLPQRTVSAPVVQKKGAVSFVEADASYYDEESKQTIYYFVGIAETKDAYYKVLCYGSIEAKEKYKADFQKILYSIND
jgi:hypothetical protein